MRISERAYARMAELETGASQNRARIAELEALLRETRSHIGNRSSHYTGFNEANLCARIDAALRSTKTEGDAPQSMGD